MPNGARVSKGHDDKEVGDGVVSILLCGVLIVDVEDDDGVGMSCHESDVVCRLTKSSL